MTTYTVKGGEAYELAGARIEVHRAVRDGAEIRSAEADGADRWAVVALPGGKAPAGWQLAGLARPNGQMPDGTEVWRVPGPPWYVNLTWAGPAAPLVLHGAGARPGWLGPETGPVNEPCQTLAEAQAAADAWWRAEPDRYVTREQPNSQLSLFEAIS
jgi:hypothetical protein